VVQTAWERHLTAANLSRARATKLSDPRMHVHQAPVHGRFMFFVGGRSADDRSLETIDVGRFD
jgi:hypothetical protein